MSASPLVLEGVSVTVIEDDDDSRELLHEILHHAGATVRSFASPDEALNALADAPTSALVADIRLPGMTGLELIARVRAHALEGVREVRAVALSGYARASDRSAALDAGFQAHISKPANPDELVAVLARVVKGA